MTEVPHRHNQTHKQEAMSDAAATGATAVPGPPPTRAELLAKCRAAQGAARQRRIRPLQGGSTRRRRGGTGAAGGPDPALPALDTPPFQIPEGAPTLQQLATVFEQCDQDLGKMCEKLGLPPAMADVVQTALKDIGEDGTLQQGLERTMALALERIDTLVGPQEGAAGGSGSGSGSGDALADLTHKVDEMLAQAGVLGAPEPTADAPMGHEHD
jgi:hypothetical protein